MEKSTIKHFILKSLELIMIATLPAYLFMYSVKNPELTSMQVFLIHWKGFVVVLGGFVIYFFSSGFIEAWYKNASKND